MPVFSLLTLKDKRHIQIARPGSSIMRKNHPTNVLANKLIRSKKLLITMVLFGCFISQPLIADNLNIIPTTKNGEQETEVSQPLNNKQSSMLLIYAKELQVLSQVIAKDYFYIHQLVREEQARIEIKQSVQDMDKAFSILSSKIKNKEVQNLLTYLSLTKIEYKDIIDKPYSTENGSLILDYSETLFEGMQSVIKSLTNNTQKKTYMYDVVLKQQLILQRISKFYIAFQAGFNDQIITVQLRESVKQFGLGLKQIDEYPYTGKLAKEVARIKKYWPIAKKFYLGMNKGDLTIIVFVSTDHMMSSLEKILKSHK